mmetsp:Transcript_43646/g.83287  ORF Transcript_43646/g.83287 Transcript_43646/m.83287 type:complete len:261 (+) Transcript_43646:579-1361(+)
MDSMRAAWRTVMVWITGAYPVRMVVGCTRITTSATKNHVASGFRLLSTSTMPLRTSCFLSWSFLLFRATATVCPATDVFTGTRLLRMLFTCTSRNAPVGSGPSSMDLPGNKLPARSVPATTVPTPCTVKLSSTCILAGQRAASAHSVRGGRWLRKQRRRSMEAPVTQEARKMGTTAPVGMPFAHESASSRVRTITGSLATPGRLSTLCKQLTVCSSTCSLHMSILLTMMNAGTLRARAMPRCSLVIPTSPPRLLSTATIV